MGEPPTDPAPVIGIVIARPSAAAVLHTPGPPPPARPIAPEERIVVIDVLRGFALLGILTVNMLLFSMPLSAEAAGIRLFPDWHDRAARWAVDLLATGKFYTLFSFLFGFGMLVQLARAQVRGDGFAALYGRRLLVLLAFGAAHILLLWFGDVLVCYAVLGFVLLMLRRCRRRTLIVCSLVFASLPPLMMSGCTAVIGWMQQNPEAAATLEREMVGTQNELQVDARREIDVYGRGGFAAILRQRVGDYLWTMLIEAFIMVPNILAMFLLGFLAGRDGALDWIAAHRARFRGLVVAAAILGLALNALWVVSMHGAGWTLPTWGLAGAFALAAVGAPALALAYAGTIVLAWDSPAWQRRLRPLAAMGRMALTNYLLQSLICTTIFYGYGFGMFGRVGNLPGLLLAITIWLAQIPLSNWWLARFRFGPAEWLWRTLTYGAAPPMRARPAQS